MHKQNWKLINWAIVKTPEDAVSDGNISNKDELVKVLKDALKKYRFRERKVITAISNQKAVTRYITMPPMPDKELREAINWEAKNHIPIYDENMKIDFKVLGKTDDNKTRLVLAGISKQTSLEYLEVLTDARLKPVAIDIYPMALQRFFGGAGNGQPFCVVDIGGFCTKLVVIKDGSIYADSIIPVGIKDIENILIDYFGIREKELSSWQETLEFVSMRGKQEYAELFQSIMPSLSELADNINRFVQFFHSQNRGQPIGKLALTGGGALWRGIGAFLAQETGIPTTSEFEYKNPILDISKVNKDKLHILSNAVGLAMRGVVY